MRAPHLTRLGAWTIAGVLAAGLAGGVAWAGTTGPTNSGATSAGSATVAAGSSTQPKAYRRAGVLRRAVYGQLDLWTRNGYLTVYVQRGKLADASSSSITLTSPGGYTATYQVTGGTRVRLDGRPATAQQLRPGDRANVVATRVDGQMLALRIVARDTVAPAHSPASPSGIASPASTA